MRDEHNAQRESDADAASMRVDASHATITRCDYCGQQFAARKRWQRFCCAAHRAQFHLTARNRAGETISIDDVRAILRQRIAHIGERPAARELKVNRAILHECAFGQRAIGPALLAAIGVERIISYRRIDR